MSSVDLVLDALQQHERLGIVQLQKMTGLCKEGTRAALRRLRSKGYVEMELEPGRRTRDATYRFVRRPVEKPASTGQVAPAPYAVGLRWNTGRIYHCGGGFATSGSGIPVPHPSYKKRSAL